MNELKTMLEALINEDTEAASVAFHQHLNEAMSKIIEAKDKTED